jgi:hypothetical protein
MVPEGAEHHPSRSESRSLAALRAVETDRGCMGTGMQRPPPMRNRAQSGTDMPMCMRVYSIYGSGYPGVLASRGVAGRGFPYYFWPVVWYGSGDDSSSYLYDSSEVR